MRSEQEIRQFIEDSTLITKEGKAEFSKLSPIEKLLTGPILINSFNTADSCIRALRWVVGDSDPEIDDRVKNAARVAGLLREGKNLFEIKQELFKDD